MRDVIIVGGGPAGLASALALCAAGLDVLVLERGHEPIDKPCGEGVLPTGLDWLERQGVRALLPPGGSARFAGIAYLNEDGTRAFAELPAPGGLGVRRSALARALATRARAFGVELCDGCAVTGCTSDASGVTVTHASGRVRARMLVAADGLHSQIRATAGLAAPAPHRRRFGLRRHFACVPWSRAVEIYFGGAAEAYVTPVGPAEVNVALLYQPARTAAHGFDELLLGFPALAARLGDAAPTSAVRGAGPFFTPVRTRVADRLALIGDAAGYVDAITGDGLSLAFTCASALAEVLPGALAHGAGRAELAPYDSRARAAFRRYAFWAQLLTGLAAHPRLRARAVALLARHPSRFAALVRWAVGPSAARQITEPSLAKSLRTPS
jgi:flavin-dependent dehydrogenase